MSDDGWITDREPGVTNMYLEVTRNGNVLIIHHSDWNASEPWKYVQLSEPYVKPKPKRIERWIVYTPFYACSTFETMENAKREFYITGGTIRHLVEQLPTDIDQDVVAEVRGCMSIVLNDEDPVTRNELFTFIMTCMNKLTPPHPTRPK